MSDHEHVHEAVLVDEAPLVVLDPARTIADMQASWARLTRYQEGLQHVAGHTVANTLFERLSEVGPFMQLCERLIGAGFTAPGQPAQPEPGTDVVYLQQRIGGLEQELAQERAINDDLRQQLAASVAENLSANVLEPEELINRRPKRAAPRKAAPRKAARTRKAAR